MTKPAIEPKSSQLPIKPRLRSGEYSATKIEAPVYSPPTEKPCAILHSSSRIGAQIPIVAYDGIRPIQNVLIDMITMVIARIFCRPYLSPSIPKNRPPNGRIKKGTEKVPSAAIICTLGLASGKKTLPRAYATKPYTPKSNHSIALPSEAAVIAFFSLLSSMMVTSRSVMGFTFFLLSIIILFCSRLERTNLRRMTRSFASCVGSGELLCSTFQA